MRTPRRRAREFAMQAIYQSFLNPEYNKEEVIENIVSSDAFIDAISAKKPKVDQILFKNIVDGVLINKEEYLEMIKDFLDRDLAQIDPIEKAILLVAGYELKNMPTTPHVVIINEAIELTKLYGGTDSHKFINGIVDKLAVKLR